jgi:hypothetical protein
MRDPAPFARPTPKMVRLYHKLVGLMGEPTDLIVFDAKESDHAFQLPLVHVPSWAADEHRKSRGD